MPRRIPDKYRLSPEDRRLERDELRFHRMLNNQHHMTWGQVFQTVRPDRTYQTFNGDIRRIHQGQELLDLIHQRVLTKSCTLLETITEVPPDTRQRPEDLWITYVDKNSGRTMVEYSQDVWATQHLPNADPTLGETVEIPLTEDEIEFLMARIILHRSKEKRLDNPRALDRAKEVMTSVFRKTLAGLLQHDLSFHMTMDSAAARASEALDRAYSLARIEQSGINMDDHPEFRSYQVFYDLGMEPPTHEEMADYIIQRFSDKSDTID